MDVRTLSLAGLLLLAGLAFAAPRELLSNGDLAQGLTGWSQNHTWYENPPGSGLSEITLEEGAGPEGENAIRITGHDNRGITMQVFPIGPGIYLASGWLKCEGMGDQTASILAEYLDASGKWLRGDTIGSVKGDSDWVRVEAELTPPLVARSLHLDLLTSGPSTGSAWFAKLSLADVTPLGAPPSPLDWQVDETSGGEGVLALTWSPEALPASTWRMMVYVEEKPFTSLKGLVPRLRSDQLVPPLQIGGLKPGKSYYVALVPMDFRGQRPEELRVQKVTVMDRSGPAAPLAWTSPILSTTGAVWLHWQPLPTAEDAAEWIIRRVDEERPRQLAKLPADVNEYAALNLGSGPKLLEVVPVDAAGNEGAPAVIKVDIPVAEAGEGSVSGLVLQDGKPARADIVVLGQPLAPARGGVADESGQFSFSTQIRAPLLLAARSKDLTGPPMWVVPGEPGPGITLNLPSSRPWRLWTLPPTAQVFQDTPPPDRKGPTPALAGVQGGTEGFQFAIRPDVDLHNVRFVVPDFANRDTQQFVPFDVTCSFVDYVLVEQNSKATPPNELLRQAPAEFPDKLSGDSSRDLKAGVTQPVYVTVRIPHQAEAAHYGGKVLLVSDEGCQGVDFDLDILPVALDPNPQLKFVYWYSWSDLAKEFNVATESPEGWQLLRHLFRKMREYHQNVIVVPKELAEVWIEDDGSLVTNWNRFDRYCELAIEEGVGELLCLSHWGGRTDGTWECPTMDFGEYYATRSSDGQQVAITPEQFAKAIYDHLIERDWLDRFATHIADEPISVNEASYKVMSERIRAVAPKLRQMDAIHVPDLVGYTDIMVPQLNYFEEWLDGFMDAQSKGLAEAWFYIAWVPQGVYPNRMIDSSYIKPRILHWYNYLYDTKGYLHWALNQWSVPFLQFSPGDNWIVWPSKTRVFDSSLRYEAQKSSLEDCQLLFQLEAVQRQMAEQLGVEEFDAKALPKAIAHTIIKDFATYARDWSQVQEAHRLLLENLGLVQAGPPVLVSVQPTEERILVKLQSEADATLTVAGSDQRGQGSLEVLLPATTTLVEASATRDGKTSTVKYPVTGFSPD